MSMGLKQLVVNWRILIVKRQKLVKRIPLLPKFMVNLETNDHHHQLYIMEVVKKNGLFMVRLTVRVDPPPSLCSGCRDFFKIS